MKKMIEKVEAFMELGGIKKDIVFLVLGGLSLIISMFDLIPLPFDAAWVAILLCGVPIIMGAMIGLMTAFDIKADVLVSLALIASICIREDFAAGEVAFIMQLGALLEDLTVAKARAGIERLVHLTPQTARLIADGVEKVIPAEQVKVGDRIRVLPGERVAVDGIILSGQTSVNQAVMTGESLPVDKTVGDEVSSGTVNQFGAFEMKATRVGEDSSIQRMIKLVQSADAGKANIVGLADKWATWIVVIALSAAGLTWAFTGEVIRAVTILVVFCPCALVLATPTAIMAAIGNATKHSFLVREGDALERLSKVSKITFDKTGTLTYGTPKVTAVKSVSDYGEDDIYAYAAAAEQLSEHPLGKAMVRCYGKEIPSCGSFQMNPGEGVTATVDGKVVKAGNLKLLKDITISKDLSDSAGEYLNEGSTVIYVALDDVLAGYIVLSDTVREESKQMIAALGKLGVQPVLLTGDHINAADAIAAQLDIREVHANCLPEDKLNHIDSYQKNGDVVCMIGDGINDAPALKKANVGIAMGGAGSAIAVDAADIALVDDEIKELPHLLSLSKRMTATIKVNLTFSMGLNFLAIALAITGLLGPVFGALVHNAGSVLVIVNSALLLNWKET
ncbi:MAG: cation-translocating P-type ATPase [Clostridiaceae bacterium]|uniref:Cd(2+)-exporting ATPase n=1 Tax=Clostridium porci TaxID=2605778 RepID=A0A7X2TBL8_9CLOT|nr:MULTISPECIES: cation-translocating P-type ATPase [Clostridium]MCI6140263.1 cadmium-translocating P-type ATPase [Clostridium sp.]MDY3231418.1 cation-translocating P-type ATPase [Clostridiaceae bacterium]MSS35006.1 cadmium-translocating P-type ATPase [Clostridium porci]